MASLATGCVVANIAHEFVDSEGLSSDGRLISSDDRVAEVLATLIVVVGISVILGMVFLWVFDHLLELFKQLWLVVVANQLRFTGNDGTFFEDELDRVSQNDASEWYASSHEVTRTISPGTSSLALISCR